MANEFLKWAIEKANIVAGKKLNGPELRYGKNTPTDMLMSMPNIIDGEPLVTPTEKNGWIGKLTFRSKNTFADQANLLCKSGLSETTYPDGNSVDVAYTMLSTTLSVDYAMFDNKKLTPEQWIGDAMADMYKNWLYKKLDTAILALVEAQRTHSLTADTYYGSFVGSTAYEYQIKYSATEAFAKKTPAIIAQLLEMNDWDKNDQFWLMMGYIGATELNHYLAQGSANSENLAYQKTMLSNLVTAPITATSGCIYSGYLLPYALGKDFRLAPRYTEGMESPEGRWYSITDPLYGIPIGVFEADTCKTGQKPVKIWQFHTNYMITPAPLSTAGASTIYKFSQLSS